jgi:hypothetical protein
VVAFLPCGMVQKASVCPFFKDKATLVCV